jgi:flagellar P-ring protein precursor FlgI
VASLGDARSLRGGVRYMAPLVAEAGGRPVAAAQGSLLLSDGVDPRQRLGPPAVETAARIPGGGQLEADLPRPTLAQSGRLLLKEPDLVTATRIAAAVDASLGAGTAVVEDPGAVTLTYKDDTPAGRATQMAKIRDITVQRDRPSRVIIDSRDGTVVAGGDISVGEAVVSHGPITLSISAGAVAAPAPGAAAGLRGDVRLAAGTSVQAIAEALHAVRTSPTEVAAIFESLRDAGAISAEVVIR